MDLTYRGADPPSDQPVPVRVAEPRPAPAPPDAAGDGTGRALRIAVIAVLAIGVFLRFASWSHLWLDEALTVNIARLPLGELTEALRHDGAPPLYYLILHAWTDVFGTSTLAVRLLPGLFGVATLPLMWFAARRLGGTRTAWAATVLLASGPFGARYATEARMYSLVMVFVLVGLLAILALLDGGGRRPAVVLGVATGLLLLTQYWAFYLVAAVGLVLAVVMRRGAQPHRTGARRAIVAMGAGSLLFLPWLPVFLYQTSHTGTPWGKPPDFSSIFDTVTQFAGGYWDPGLVLGLMYFGLVFLALFGWPVDNRRVLLELRPRAPGSALAAVTFATLAVAVVAGQISRSAFAVRYAAVVYPFLIILVALGAQVFVDRRVYHGLLAVAVIAGLWASFPNVVGDRTSAAKVAQALAANAQPGDVVAYCPDQLGPSVTRELGAAGNEFDQLTFPRATRPEFVDWVDYAKFSKAADPAAFAEMLIERAGPAHEVFVVWAPGYRTFKAKCQALLSELDELRPISDRPVKVSTRYFERPGLIRFRGPVG
ncbi:MAG: glycosyltransferase family 39 protein [Acidimicrobiales bacterium]